MRKTLTSFMMAFALVPSFVRGQEEDKKEKRFQLLIHANYQYAIRTFEEATSFTQFLEQGSTTRAYSGGDGAAFDLSGLFIFSKKVSLLWSFELLPVTHDATVDVSTPHPLLFNRPRTAEMAASELSYEEFASHFGLAYRIVASPVEFELFGGPSLFSVTTEVVDEVTWEEEYPFDDISGSSGRVDLDKFAFGFHAGGGVVYFVTESWGFSFMARYSKANINLMREGGEPFSLEAGGFRAGGGIRIKF